MSSTPRKIITLANLKKSISIPVHSKKEVIFIPKKETAVSVVKTIKETPVAPVEKRYCTEFDFLCETYPQLFSTRRDKPIKIGISLDILEDIKKRFPDQAESEEFIAEWKNKIKVGLRYYTNFRRYQKTVRDSDWRYDLEGNKMDDPISEAQKKYADSKADYMKKIHLQKNKPTKK